MDAPGLLAKIISSTKPEEIFSKSNYKKEYLHYLKLLHPDVCTLPRAGEAVVKLNLYRKQMEELSKMEDDAGLFQLLNERTLVFKGEKAVLQRSQEGYQRLMKLNDASSNHFKQYLPSSMEWQDDALLVSHPERMVPLANLTLPQEHVTWVFSRMLELVAWMHQVGYCHAGITPESICVVPKTHGIVCVSFYHLTPLNSKLNTISGKYLNWYPPIVFDEKRAIPYVDNSLAQRSALYLLGDPSGNGVKLKKIHNEYLIDFLITPHYDAYHTYDAYRSLLKTVFGKPTFHKLNL